MASTDESLIARAQAGDESALEALLRGHRAQLMRTVEASLSRRTKGFLAADDVVQETFVDAYLRIESFVSPSTESFAAWLRTIARRKICDAVRARRAIKRGGGMGRSGHDGTAAAIPITLDSVVQLLAEATATTPSRSLARREVSELIGRLIERLPPDYARLVRSDLAGRPAEELAAELGKSTGAIYAMRHRVYDELRRLFQGRTTEVRRFL